MTQPVTRPVTRPVSGLRRAGEAVRRRPDAAWALLVAAATAVLGVLPVLRTRDFYVWGDSSAQFAPTWFHLGRLLREGHWPLWLDPGAWVGGNYAAEALYGIYDPLNVPVWLLLSSTGDLRVGMVLVKLVALVVLALGTYAVARDHGARPWAAAAVAVALPFSGYTLYWDTAAWVSGLQGFALAPWVWWAFRRTAAGRLNPLWAWVVGSLAVLGGNPYGTLGVVVVGAAVVVDSLVGGHRRGAVRLLLTGLCVAAWLPLVYGPLLETASLAIRSQGALFSNDDKMRPQLGDLLQLSSPAYVPGIPSIRGATSAPITYLAWFVLPVLPWVRWSTLRPRWRSLTGALVVATIYAVLAIGPSKFWLFRWPMRMVEYAWLGVVVVLAVLLSAGLAHDRFRGRLAATAGIVLLGSWATWSQDPAARRAAVLGAALLVVLVGALVVLARRRAPGSLVGLLLVAGCGLSLAVQLVLFPYNDSSRRWSFPTDVAALQQRFEANGYDGRVLQLADLASLQRPGKVAQAQEAWRHYLAGSMYQVAGVEAVNSYSGLGYLPFTRQLCLSYDGLARACGYRQLWEPDPLTGEPLADLMRLDTVVVQRSMTDGVVLPAGWQAEDVGHGVVVVRRTVPQTFPGAELSWVSPGLQVTGARTDGPNQQSVTVGGSSGSPGGRLVFALLDWPGYEATLDGRPVPVSATHAGLLTVTVPDGAAGRLVVQFRPPLLVPGLAAAALGALGALALGAVELRRRRQRRPEPSTGTQTAVRGSSS